MCITTKLLEHSSETSVWRSKFAVAHVVQFPIFGLSSWHSLHLLIVNKLLVSKEAVVLHLWEAETLKFGFIKVQSTTAKDLDS